MVSFECGYYIEMGNTYIYCESENSIESNMWWMAWKCFIACVSDKMHEDDDDNDNDAGKSNCSTCKCQDSKFNLTTSQSECLRLLFWA